MILIVKIIFNLWCCIMQHNISYRKSVAWQIVVAVARSCIVSGWVLPDRFGGACSGIAMLRALASDRLLLRRVAVPEEAL